MSKSYDLSTSTKWANLADGDHVVKLRAKGTGFGTSSFSNSVTVTKGNPSHTVVISCTGYGDSIKIYESDSLPTAYVDTPADSTLLGTWTTGQQSVTLTKKYLLLRWHSGVSALVGTNYKITPSTNATLVADYPKTHAPVWEDLTIFTVSGDVAINQSAVCLTGDTLVTMADYSNKRLDEISVGDLVLSIDFTVNKPIYRKVIYSDKDENNIHTEFDEWTFDDGTVIKTVHRHEFYNVEARRMKYMDEWKIGEHTLKQDGSHPALISHRNIKEKVNHYKITLEENTAYFANGLLTGDRLCPKGIEL